MLVAVRFGKIQEDNECDSKWSGICSWLLFNGDVRDISAKHLAEAYFLANQKYNRSAEDEKEVKACMRLDRAFACGLVRCADNADLEYKPARIDVYSDIISKVWNGDTSASKASLFPSHMEEINEEFRRRIHARTRRL